LVYNKENPPQESTSLDISETDDGHTIPSEIDLCSEAQPEETIQSVKVCYRCVAYMSTQTILSEDPDDPNILFLF
jgi:hypothetical protein